MINKHKNKKIKRVVGILTLSFSALFYAGMGFFSQQINRNYTYNEAILTKDNNINLAIVSARNIKGRVGLFQTRCPFIDRIFSPFSDGCYFLPQNSNYLRNYSYYTDIADFQYQNISNYMDGNMYQFYSTFDIESSSNENVLNVSDWHIEEPTIFRSIKAELFQGYIRVNNGETPYFASKDPRLSDLDNCRMPLANNEMAITDFQADLILEYGLKNPNKSFSNIDEIIGQQIQGFTITGIYKTCNYSKYIDAYLNTGDTTKNGDLFFLYSFISSIESFDTQRWWYAKYVIDLDYKPDKLGELFNSCHVVKCQKYEPAESDSSLIIDNDHTILCDTNIQIFSSLGEYHFIKNENIALNYHRFSNYMNLTLLIFVIIFTFISLVKYPRITDRKSFVTAMKQYGIMTAISFASSVVLLLLTTLILFIALPMAGYVFTFKTLLYTLLPAILHYILIVIILSCKALKSHISKNKSNNVANS